MAIHPEFSREELVLIFDAYRHGVTSGGEELDALCAELRALPANAANRGDPTFRNAAGVGTALRRFREIDEGALPAQYRPHYREVWAAYRDDREQLQRDAQDLRTGVRLSPAPPSKREGPDGARQLPGGQDPSIDRLPRIGSVAGVPVGALFQTRRELHDAGVHRPLQAGIAGTVATGAESIVVSGGYEDDADYGEEIIYTGHGGQGGPGGRQIDHQTLERGNAALARSCETGQPVRVIRGAGGDRAHSPSSGYRYDGLFSVAEYWRETGRAGFDIWRFRLERDEEAAVSDGQGPGAGREGRYATVQRLVRNTAVTQWVKEHHNYTCQICGVRLATQLGGYAEGAHIRPVGRPHHGPDIIENVLCLCANDHVLFDRGALVITATLAVIDRETQAVTGQLRVAGQHRPGESYLAYHRSLWQ